MNSARLSQAMRDLELEVYRSLPQVRTYAPTGAYPNGYQQVQVRDQVSRIALQSSTPTSDRLDEAR